MNISNLSQVSNAIQGLSNLDYLMLQADLLYINGSLDPNAASTLKDLPQKLVFWTVNELSIAKDIATMAPGSPIISDYPHQLSELQDEFPELQLWSHRGRELGDVGKDNEILPIQRSLIICQGVEFDLMTQAPLISEGPLMVLAHDHYREDEGQRIDMRNRAGEFPLLADFVQAMVDPEYTTQLPGPRTLNLEVKVYDDQSESDLQPLVDLLDPLIDHYDLILSSASPVILGVNTNSPRGLVIRKSE